jgi:holo-[acyl-carrier protein] synthase
MVFGIGIDMIEVDRVAEKVTRQEFKERVFTVSEIEYCEATFHDPKKYAARFAAKEAFFKALGTGWMGQFSLREVEIVNDEFGKPSFVLHGEVKEWVFKKGIQNIFLSISHLRAIAGAVVVLET